MRISNRSLLPAALWGLGVLVFPIPCFAGAGTTMLINFVQVHVINNAIFIFGPIASVALFFYGYRAIAESQSDSALTNATKSFVNALIGFAVIALAVPFSNIVPPCPNLPTNALPVPCAPTTLNTLTPGLYSLIDFIITAAGGIFILMVTIHGIQLVASGGDSGQAEKLRKGITVNTAGAILMLTASAIVNTVEYNDPAHVGRELVGLIQYMLVIIAVVTVLAFIFAGVLLIISIDEGLRDRSKKIVIGTIISLVIVTASYSLLALLFG